MIFPIFSGIATKCLFLQKGVIYGIGVCPNDSNLVACGGRYPLIYDRRMSKVASVIRGARIYYKLTKIRSSRSNIPCSVHEKV